LITNKLLKGIILFHAGEEKFKTITKVHIALAKRTIFWQFFNSITPILFFDFYFTKGDLVDLSEVALAVGILNNVATLLSNMIDFNRMSKKSKQKIVFSQKRSAKLTQQQANYIMEDPDVEIHFFLANLIR